MVSLQMIKDLAKSFQIFSSLKREEWGYFKFLLCCKTPLWLGITYRMTLANKLVTVSWSSDTHSSSCFTLNVKLLLSLMSINPLFSRCEIFFLLLYIIKNNLNKGKICTVKSPFILPQKLPTGIQIHRHLQLTRDISTSDLQGNR